MRAAVYCGTRNVYKDMIPSMKSLLIHSNVQKIYFLIQDDQFPYDLPKEVECVNVSDQKFFTKDCINYNSRCSYMVLLRAAFPKIFSNLDKILSVDNDIIINQNISELWDINLKDNYFAGVAEPRKSTKTFKYINFGLVMYNLEQLRKDKKDDQIIDNLNTYYYLEAEQDCFNLNCQNRILQLPVTYNCNYYTLQKPNATQAKIRHYAYTSKWQSLPIIQKYREIEIIKNITDNYNLDIIIPYYNDFQGLKNTLNSIYQESLSSNITITVVDDASQIKPNSLKEQYPLISIINVKENHGPGPARQTGIDNTQSPYIMFIDAGDIFINKNNFNIILETIKNHGSCHFLQFQWKDQQSGNIFSDDDWCIHGTIFNRNFLNMYNIRFPSAPQCAYCSDDVAFMKSCRLIEENIYVKERLTNIYSHHSVIYLRTYDESSITNNAPYKKIIPSIVNNSFYVVEKARENNVSNIIIANFVTKIMLVLFENYMSCAKYAPNFLEYNLIFIKNYYNKLFKSYEKINQKILQEEFHSHLKTLLSLTSDSFPKVNLTSFINSLKE